MTVRGVVKSFAEFAVVNAGAARVVRRRLRGRALVLAYHNVVPAGERPAGEASLHLPQAEFSRHLDLIARTNDVVPLESILDDVGDSARPRVVITFDDAYIGAMSAGLHELATTGDARDRLCFSGPSWTLHMVGLPRRIQWWSHSPGYSAVRHRGSAG